MRRFTRARWQRWLDRLAYPEPLGTEQLRAGIEAFRKQCAEYEPFRHPHKIPKRVAKEPSGA